MSAKSNTSAPGQPNGLRPIPKQYRTTLQQNRELNQQPHLCSRHNLTLRCFLCHHKAVQKADTPNTAPNSASQRPEPRRGGAYDRSGTAPSTWTKRVGKGILSSYSWEPVREETEEA